MTGRGLWAGVIALCLVQFVDVLGVTVVVTALPHMLRDLDAPAVAGSLVSTGYAMCFGGLLMLGARLGDRYGHRRCILAGLVVFALAAALGAVAGSVALLTAARCLQGAAAAISVPAALRLLTSITRDASDRRRAIGLWSAAGAAAGASGFVVGGVITQLAGWRVVLWANLPLAAALAASVWRSVPRDPVLTRRVALEPASSLAFTAATMLFVIATTLTPEHGQAGIGLAALAGAGAAIVAFRLVDRRASAPLLPRALWARPSLRAGTLGSFLNTATTSSAMTLATLYLQDSRARSPLTAALLLLPFSLAVIPGSTLAARVLGARHSGVVVAAGLSAIAAGDAALILGAPALWPVPICAACSGAGIGFSSVACTGLATSVSESARGTASGLVNTAAQLGTALGIAVALLVADLTTGALTRGSDTPGHGRGVTALVGAAAAVRFAASARPAARSGTAARPATAARPGTPARPGTAGQRPQRAGAAD